MIIDPYIFEIIQEYFDEEDQRYIEDFYVDLIYRNRDYLLSQLKMMLETSENFNIQMGFHPLATSTVHNAFHAFTEDLDSHDDSKHAHISCRQPRKTDISEDYLNKIFKDEIENFSDYKDKAAVYQKFKNHVLDYIMELHFIDENPFFMEVEKIEKIQNLKDKFAWCKQVKDFALKGYLMNTEEYKLDKDKTQSESQKASPPEIFESFNFCQTEIDVDPDVKAYRVLVRAPRFPEKSTGGVYIPDEFREDHKKTINLGLVLKLGPLAFQGDIQKHFAVTEGTWVWYSKYERESISIPPNHVCYFINDDRILGAVKPSDVKKVLNGGT